MQDRTEHAVDTTNAPSRVLAAFPAGHPRGDRPAKQAADAYTASGTPATVVMDLRSDEFLVVKWGV